MRRIDTRRSIRVRRLTATVPSPEQSRRHRESISQLSRTVVHYGAATSAGDTREGSRDPVSPPSYIGRYPRYYSVVHASYRTVDTVTRVIHVPRCTSPLRTDNWIDDNTRSGINQTWKYVTARVSILPDFIGLIL